MTDTTSPRQDDVELPDVITRYQDAHDRHDTTAALSAFAPDARVVDENREHRGTDDIEHWLRTAATEFTYTRTTLRAEVYGPDTWLVLNRLDGDFPGGTANLSYKFVLAGDLIAEVLITP